MNIQNRLRTLEDGLRGHDPGHCKCVLQIDEQIASIYDGKPFDSKGYLRSDGDRCERCRSWLERVEKIYGEN